jgi:hypothetical protein
VVADLKPLNHPLILPTCQPHEGPLPAVTLTSR